MSNELKEEYLELFGKAMPQIIHDIRNPLNIIIGFSSLMEMDTTLNEENREFVEKIKKSGMMIENMLSNIDFFDLDISDVEFDTVEISDILQEMTKNSYLLNLQDVTIEKNPIDNFSTYTSPLLMSKIFNCLLGFTSKGFKTTVVEKKIYVGLLKYDTYFNLLYSDTSNSALIDSDYFTFETSISARRGVYPIFLQNFVKMLDGSVQYLQQKQWFDTKNSFAPNTEHGFVIKLPLKQQ